MSINYNKYIKDFTVLSSSGQPDILDNCIVQFSNGKLNLNYNVGGGKNNLGYLSTATTTGTTNTQFKLTYDKNLQKYIIYPMAGTNANIQLWYDIDVKGDGQLVSGVQPTDTFKSENKYFNLNVIDKDGSFGPMLPTCNINVTNKWGSFFIGINSENTVTNTATKWTIVFIRLGKNAWSRLMTNNAISKYCCMSASGSELISDVDFSTACKDSNLITGSDDCNKRVATACAESGYDPSTPDGMICKAWCIKNPTDCYANIEKWCRANPTNKACACFDISGFNTFSKKFTENCREPCPISKFTPGCFYPPCLFSGYSDVYNQGVACPADVSIHQKCIMDFDGKNITADKISLSCIQNADTNVDVPPPINTPGIVPPPINTPGIVPPPINTPGIVPPPINTKEIPPPLINTPGIPPQTDVINTQPPQQQPDFWTQYRWWIIGGVIGFVILLILAAFFAKKNPSV
jgi:hypothetical protein